MAPNLAKKHIDEHITRWKKELEKMSCLYKKSPGGQLLSVKWIQTIQNSTWFNMERRGLCVDLQLQTWILKENCLHWWSHTYELIVEVNKNNLRYFSEENSHYILEPTVNMKFLRMAWERFMFSTPGIGMIFNSGYACDTVNLVNQNVCLYVLYQLNYRAHFTCVTRGAHIDHLWFIENKNLESLPFIFTP